MEGGLSRASLWFRGVLTVIVRAKIKDWFGGANCNWIVKCYPNVCNWNVKLKTCLMPPAKSGQITLSRRLSNVVLKNYSHPVQM